MLNISSATDSFLEISQKFSKTAFPKTTSYEVILLKGIIIVTGNKNMTKITFRLRGRPDKSYGHMGQQSSRGDDLVIITVRASI